MGETMKNILTELRTKRFVAVFPLLTDEDVVLIWDGVCNFIRTHLHQQKGVHVPGLGTFSFTQKRLDVGHNKHILLQRPVFVLAERLTLNHGLHCVKQHVSGRVPVVKLNFATISSSLDFNRDIIEQCVREIFSALSRCIAAAQSIEFTFTGIGKLYIFDLKVKMKFFKDFIMSIDVVNHVRVVECAEASRDCLPESEDSVVDRDVMDKECKVQRVDDKRCSTSELHRPRIILKSDVDHMENTDRDCSIAQSPLPGLSKETSHKLSPPPPKLVRILSPESSPEVLRNIVTAGSDVKSAGLHTGRSGADGARDLSPENRNASAAESSRVDSAEPRCRHTSGQEMCYICWQRERRNQPVSFRESLRRRELEHDRLLQEVQLRRDYDAISSEEVMKQRRRSYGQEVASFNLVIAESKHSRKRDAHSKNQGYVFPRRAVTPPKHLRQREYLSELTKQFEEIENARIRDRERRLQEKLEQIQLAEELARQRDEYKRHKTRNEELYREALNTQVLTGRLDLAPATGADSDVVVFGRSDASVERLAEQRQRNRDLLQEQLEAVDSRTRSSLQQQSDKQRQEAAVLGQARQQLVDEQASRYQRTTDIRRSLEQDWSHAVEAKQHNEHIENLCAQTPGKSVLDQVEQYRRCRQCQRRSSNCGHSNIWSETRYTSGSRLMV
ncbi:PREDICTED: coiled-coil domain-containing protein 81-like isoform X2 [Priapulus caudatus]|uniref:Coiled-coil domain-containing protein 81-like isoform X2 n=1 Tax=Priapulus caudatus TaxID=37621 RepID=A0ABM1EC09_PRICU|nr:PREDICTED: coiled-coil domain-containing protein 81-like isoform X2 [Priapulus caudatus]